MSSDSPQNVYGTPQRRRDYSEVGRGSLHIFIDSRMVTLYKYHGISILLKF